MAHGPSLGGQTHQHVEADISDMDHTDAEAIHDNVGGEINLITAKTTLADADLMLLEDSEASYAKKKVQVSNLGVASDVQYSSSDITTGTSYSSTEATMATKALTVAAGDIIKVEIWAWSTDASTDDLIVYSDLGNAFQAPTPPSGLNLTGDIGIGCINYYSVVSTGQAYSILWTLPSPASHGTFPDRKAVAELPCTMWEEIATDVTGSQNLTLHVVALAGQTGTITWAAQIRQWGETA